MYVGSLRIRIIMSGLILFIEAFNSSRATLRAEFNELQEVIELHWSVSTHIYLFYQWFQPRLFSWTLNLCFRIWICVSGFDPVSSREVCWATYIQFIISSPWLPGGQKYTSNKQEFTKVFSIEGIPTRQLNQWIQFGSI